jgi:hypothetical protein
MRLWIFSDLHQDLQDNAWDPCAHAPDHDIAVVAGDVHSPLTSAIDWLADRLPGVPEINGACLHRRDSYGHVAVARDHETAKPQSAFLSAGASFVAVLLHDIDDVKLVLREHLREAVGILDLFGGLGRFLFFGIAELGPVENVAPIPRVWRPRPLSLGITSRP